jgi:hypothetical protein
LWAIWTQFWYYGAFLYALNICCKYILFICRLLALTCSVCIFWANITEYVRSAGICYLGSRSISHWHSKSLYKFIYNKGRYSLYEFVNMFPLYILACFLPILSEIYFFIKILAIRIVTTFYYFVWKSKILLCLHVYTFKATWL